MIEVAKTAGATMLAAMLVTMPLPSRLRQWIGNRAPSPRPGSETTDPGSVGHKPDTARKAAYMGNAGMAFLIRMAGAGLGFGLQVLLARMLALSDYGLYVTFWTWLFVAGQISTLGFNDAVLRFLPRYTARARNADAAGFLRTGWHTVVIGSLGIAITGLAAAAILSAMPATVGIAGDHWILVALLFAGIPILAIELYLEGIARASGWFALAIIPAYVLRPVAMAAVVAVLAGLGTGLDAAAVLAIALSVTALLTAGQALILRQRLTRQLATQTSAAAPLPTTRHRRNKRRLWLRATLPLVLIYGIEELYIASDILLLGLLAEPADVGIYFAAVRVMTLAGYVYYAFMLISSREFSLARADRDTAALQARVLYATKWTFLLTVPAVAVMLVAGYPLLYLFGPEFTAAWPAMAVLGLGLLARASVGQAGDLLVVLGHQRENLIAAASSLILNIALTLALVPVLGILGAAVGTALSQSARAIILARAANIKIRRIVSGIDDGGDCVLCDQVFHGLRHQRIIKQEGMIDARQALNDLQPFVLRNDRLTLVFAHAPVTDDTDDQPVADSPGFLQKRKMVGVQEVKDTIGKHYFFRQPHRGKPSF